MIIWEIISTFISGFIVGIKAFVSCIPIYQTLSGLKTEIIAIALGIPTIILTLGSIVYKIIKFLYSN